MLTVSSQQIHKTCLFLNKLIVSIYTFIYIVEPSLQSPHTFDACSTNATMSTMATRSTPENFLTNAHAGKFKKKCFYFII